MASKGRKKNKSPQAAPRPADEAPAPPASPASPPAATPAAAPLPPMGDEVERDPSSYWSRLRTDRSAETAERPSAAPDPAPAAPTAAPTSASSPASAPSASRAVRPAPTTPLKDAASPTRATEEQSAEMQSAPKEPEPRSPRTAPTGAAQGERSSSYWSTLAERRQAPAVDPAAPSTGVAAAAAAATAHAIEDEAAAPRPAAARVTDVVDAGRSSPAPAAAAATGAVDGAAKSPTTSPPTLEPSGGGSCGYRGRDRTYGDRDPDPGAPGRGRCAGGSADAPPPAPAAVAAPAPHGDRCAPHSRGRCCGRSGRPCGRRTPSGWAGHWSSSSEASRPASQVSGSAPPARWRAAPARRAAVRSGGCCVIPKLGVTAPVEDGVGDDQLNVAVGHLPTSVWPGAAGNSVLEAHDVSYFVNLAQLSAGDTVQFQSPCTTLRLQGAGPHIVQQGTPVYNTTGPDHDPGHLLADQRAVVHAAALSGDSDPRLQHAAPRARRRRTWPPRRRRSVAVPERVWRRRESHSPPTRCRWAPCR